jgi:hypothetical protein
MSDISLYAKLNKNTYSNNKAAIHTKGKAQVIRIKQEINLLYKKEATYQ